MLAFEKYLSDRPINKICCHIYKLDYPFTPENGKDDVIKVYRGVCRHLNKKSKEQKYNAISDDGVIYTMNEIIDEHLSGIYPPNKPKAYSLHYQGMQEMDYITNQSVYAFYVKQVILEQLRQVELDGCKMKKYEIWDDIPQTKWIKDYKEGGAYTQYYGKERKFILKREFCFDVEVRDDGFVCLILNSRSVFQGISSLAEYLDAKIEVTDMYVKYAWYDASFAQGGIVEKVGPETVVDLTIPDEKPEKSLKKYFLTTHSKNPILVNKINNISDSTKVVKIKTKKGKILTYYPNALIPSFSYERVKCIDNDFLKKIRMLLSVI